MMYVVQECLEVCCLLVVVLEWVLVGGICDVVLDFSNVFVESVWLQQIVVGGYRGVVCEQICGNGYVVDSLEVVFWCFDCYDIFEVVVFEVVNFGEDVDIMVVIVGQLVGVFYGVCGIFGWWLQWLVLCVEIQVLVDVLYVLN